MAKRNKRNNRKRGMRNVLDHKYKVVNGGSGATEPVDVTAAQLQILNRPARILSVRWTATSIDPHTHQVVMYNAAGEEERMSVMKMVHKNVSNGSISAPRGSDFGVYSTGAKVCSVFTDSTSASQVITLVTVRVAYSEPYGLNPV
jgi:hypothetical protein